MTEETAGEVMIRRIQRPVRENPRRWKTVLTARTVQCPECETVYEQTLRSFCPKCDIYFDAEVKKL